MDKEELQQCIGFHWDEANLEKNWRKHSVHWQECEEVFFNEPLLIYQDEKHSIKETRSYALGCTNESRQLMVVFTIRNNLIRIISARPMSKKERLSYDKAKQK